jgi:hypothetical protein
MGMYYELLVSSFPIPQLHQTSVVGVIIIIINNQEAYQYDLTLVSEVLASDFIELSKSVYEML